MKKILLFLLIFTPFHSLYADDCEIELHTGSVQRTGSFVFPKGSEIQKFEVTYLKESRHQKPSPDKLLENIEAIYGNKWSYALQSGKIKIIGDLHSMENTQEMSPYFVRLEISVNPKTVSLRSDERQLEYYPYDYQYLYSYLGVKNNAQNGLVLPKIYIFSSDIITNINPQYKICTIDQGKIAEMGGYHIEKPGKSYVVIPYYTFTIPLNDEPEENYFFAYDVIDILYGSEYVDTFIKDGKPHSPIEYKK